MVEMDKIVSKKKMLCKMRQPDLQERAVALSCSSFKPYCQYLQNPCSATILIATDTQFKCMTAYITHQQSCCNLNTLVRGAITTENVRKMVL